MTGIFITFEGPDGCGKTCQIKPLAEFLRSRGYDVITTREPGGTDISEQIRSVIMNMANKGMHPRTEILLFQASRAQHVEELIRPALKEGKIVLCDRYTDSTLAYQGYGHQSDMTFLRSLLDFTTGSLIPDLSLYFDLDVEEGLRRRMAGRGEWNRMDDYEIDFHRRVRTGYQELVRQDPARWATIDASASIADVTGQIQTTLLNYLQRRQVPERNQ